MTVCHPVSAPVDGYAARPSIATYQLQVFFR
jgi:hypothetical protein